MAKRTVHVEFTRSYVIEVEAGSLDEACAKVHESFNDKGVQSLPDSSSTGTGSIEAY